MSLQTAIDAALPALRAEAEARMISRCTVRRRSAEGAQNESTGLKANTWADIYTDLPCRISGSRGASASQTVTTGGVEVEMALRTAHFPADTDGLADGDLIELTAGENAGEVLRIVEADWQDQATARRVPVVATPRPAEWD